MRGVGNRLEADLELEKSGAEGSLKGSMCSSGSTVNYEKKKGDRGREGRQGREEGKREKDEDERQGRRGEDQTGGRVWVHVTPLLSTS